MTTCADALALAQDLRQCSESPRLDAELLLGHVLRLDRGALRARGERLLSASELREFHHLLERRKRREPVAYLLGRAGFMDFELEVSPRVLIPRPETELLVELAIETITPGGSRPIRIADLGTGSGAIAIALARHHRDATVVAIDHCEGTLAVARRNAKALAGANLQLRLGCWCEGLASESLDMIVANPPYVAVDDPALHPDCAWEPATALFAGADGLAAFRQILPQAMRCLKSGAWLLLEHGHNQRQQLVELLAANDFGNISGYQDHAGHDRLIRARRP